MPRLKERLEINWSGRTWAQASWRWTMTRLDTTGRDLRRRMVLCCHWVFKNYRFPKKNEIPMLKVDDDPTAGHNWWTRSEEEEDHIVINSIPLLWIGAIFYWILSFVSYGLDSKQFWYKEGWSLSSWHFESSPSCKSLYQHHLTKFGLCSQVIEDHHDET